MELFRAHAYAVSPQRGMASPIAPEGGGIPITAEFQRIIAENLKGAKLEERNRFESSQATRFNRTMGRYVGVLA